MSPFGSLNSHDVTRVLETLAQVAALAVVTAVIGMVSGANFGAYTPVIMTVGVPLLEALKRLLQGAAQPSGTPAAL